MTPEAPQVDPKKVQEFLQERADKTRGTEETVVLDYAELRQRAEQDNEEIARQQEAVEANRNKNFEPDKASLAHLSAWALDSSSFKTEVTDEDKALFLKSLLNDTPLELGIKLEIGLNMDFRILNNYEMEVVYLTLDGLSKEGKILGPAQYASLVQQAAAALQLVSYASKPVTFASFTPRANTPEDDVKTLREAMETRVALWSSVKWQAVIMGLRIFEAKLAICNENCRNANFWNPAGAN